MDALARPLAPRNTPRRNGIYYGSDACCGAKFCTWAAFQEAMQKSKALAEQLGPDWSPRVWENLGWYWEVVDEGGVWHIDEHAGGYWAYISAPDDNAIEADAHGSTPLEAMNAAAKKLKARMQRDQIIFSYASTSLNQVNEREPPRLLPEMSAE